MHKILLDNNSKDVGKSERNIVNKNLSQNNSADIPENTITELKDKEHKEPLVIQKVISYLNIFECGRNLLDQIDVTYQRVFMAKPEDEYYKEMTKSLIKANNDGGK